MVPGSINSFRLLIVCRANQIRSPIAEMLFRHAVTQCSATTRRTWDITSAGVEATAGLFMHPLADRLLTVRHIPHENFRTTRVTSQLLASADLILTAERSHRSQVVVLNPTVLHRAFTIRQFARLLESVPAGMMASVSDASMVELAASRRSLVRAHEPNADDIADPVGRSFRHVRRTADVIQEAVNCVVAATGMATSHRTR